MFTWMRTISLTMAALTLSPAFSQNSACFSASQHHLLLTAFYYPSNLIIAPDALNDYKEAVDHLDVLNYSTSYYGLMYTHNAYVLADIAKQNLITIRQWMQKNNIKTKMFLSLGHWSSDDMRQVFTNEKERTHFIDAVIEVLKDKAYNLSGIDLDWENFFSPRPAEVKGFPIFIKQLREALNKNGLNHVCLSLDLPVSTAFAKRYPAPKDWIADIDWANLMAYEYYGIDPSHTELDATLGTVTAPYAGTAPHYVNLSMATSLDYYVTETHIPKNKLVIAVPFYGNVNYVHFADKAHQYGLRQKVIDDRSIITTDYSSIYESFGIAGQAKNGAEIHTYTFEQPAAVKGTHAYWSTKLITESPQVGKSYKFVSYPDPASLKEITQFAKKEGYLGLSAWQLDYDLPFSHPHSLLKAIYTTIHGK